MMNETEKGEFVVYHPDAITRLDVMVKNDTVWLNRQQLAVLFGRDVKTIGKHINNALKEELGNFSVVANFATTAADGKIYNVEYYNLEMILSIGYRVKSQRGIYFRRWANNVLKEYLLKGYALNNRFAVVEKQLEEQRQMLACHEQKINFFVRTSLPPVEGVYLIGASIKDLGKKWFGFTLMENTVADELISRLQ